MTLGLALTVVVVRTLRSSLLEVLQSDYIDAARARGLSERRIVAKHALRNAVMPTITILSINIGFLIGGTVVIEPIFRIPGLGSLLSRAVQRSDYQLVQGLVAARGRDGRGREPARRLPAGADRSARAAGGSMSQRRRGPCRRARRAGAAARTPTAGHAGADRHGDRRAARLAALLAPLIAPYDPTRSTSSTSCAALARAPVGHRRRRAATSSRARCTACGSTSAIVLLVTYVPLPIGVLLGRVAGSFGGWSTR